MSARRGLISIGSRSETLSVAARRDLEYASHTGAMEYGPCVPFNWEHQTKLDPGCSATQSRVAFGGYATRFDKVHAHKGRLEVFRPGVFAKSLLNNSEIRFLEDHDESKCLAVTDGAGLRVWSDDVGLSFKVELPGTVAAARIFEHVKAGKKASMSVGYETIEVEDRVIAGENVRFIRSARLNEISIVSAGAVKEAFIQVLPEDDDLDSHFRLTKGHADCQGAMARFRECLAATKEAVKVLTK